MTLMPWGSPVVQYEWAIRSRVEQSARALNYSGVQFEIFEKSRCNERYWKRTANGGFLLKSGISPSVAIRDIYESGSLYAFECATAILMVLYKAVLESIQEEKFNSLFAALYLQAWQYDADLRLKITHNLQEVKPGDVVYFKNPDVNPQTPYWRGENAVQLSNHLYYGHGMGIVTGEEIIARLNSARKLGSIISAYLTDTIVQLDYTYLFAISRE
jgi:protein-glutamine gamma-glutamyltransferase